MLTLDETAPEGAIYAVLWVQGDQVKTAWYEIREQAMVYIGWLLTMGLEPSLYKLVD